MGELEGREAVIGGETFGEVVHGAANVVDPPCPFHEDAKPFCSIHVGKGLFHCFGCGAKGNVLDFVHRMEALGGATVSIREAGLKLASICGVPIGQASESPPETRREAREPARGKQAARNRDGAPRASGGQDGDNKPLGFALTLDPA
jgi:CHC2 zinc finger